MGIGSAGLLLLTIDRYLQYLQYSERRDVFGMVGSLQEVEARKRAEIFEMYKDKPVLYHAKVIFKYQMSGTHGLKSVKLGDTLQVLEEGVGPGQGYSMCRKRNEESGEVASIGWYPVTFVERIQPKRKAWWRLF
jgi:hypothetical protein